ncbi:MAG: cytochrome P450 [Alphaproteobacteria bacterium]|nr:cytochrome P450 [Alphaproteobacteria bacterium]
MSLSDVLDDRRVMPADVAARMADPKAYGEWAPIHRNLTWLRQNMPLALANVDGYDPFWVVTKYEDIKEIGRQPTIFLNNGIRKTLINQDFARRSDEALAEGRKPFNRSLLTMDAPEHMRYRLIAAPRFSPKSVKTLTDKVREIARGVFDRLEGDGGECDFMDTVSNRYPLRVIIALLGLPPEDEDMLLDMTQRFFSPSDPDVTAEQKGNSIGATANHDVAHEMFEYFSAIVAERRRNPGDDIASVIANAQIDGKPIELFDAASYYMTIATAGHDTTASSTGGAVWALAERPDEFAKVKANRKLIPSLMYEAVRWTSPVSHFMRTATADYTLRGQQIRAGDWLMLCYPSANRDEDIFPDPFEFRADRVPNPQLGFGFGAHVCLGQHLAKLEMQIFFEELFNRVDLVELAGEPRRFDSIVVGGVKRLPLRYRLAK